MSTTTERPSVVYRFFDEENRLLYVGVTNDVAVRTRSHMRRPWMDLVRRMEVERFASRGEALEAEAAAIRSESPLYNVAMPADPRRNRPVDSPLTVLEEDGCRIVVAAYECRRCQHVWTPRANWKSSERGPKVCPKCKSPYWDTPRTRPKPTTS